jgi:hypothetical protein
MTKPTKGPAAKRARSGPSLTAAERRANGLALLQGLWLPSELVARVDAECERRGLRRTALVRTALEEWLAKVR